MKAPPNTSQTPAARILPPTQALTVSYHLLQEECTDEKGTGSLGERRNKEPANPHRGPGKAEMLDSLQAAEHSGWAPPASWGFCAVVMNGLWVLTGKRGLLRKLRPTFWLRSHMEEGSAECVHQSLPKLTTSTTLKWIILRTSKIFFFWWGGEAQLAAYVPPSGIKPGSMQQLKAWHLNQQTASEFPKKLLKALDVIN